MLFGSALQAWWRVDLLLVVSLERRSKQHHDPAGEQGKAVASSTKTQKRTWTSTPEPTEKVAKLPKVVPQKARKTLPRIKMDVPIASG